MHRRIQTGAVAALFVLMAAAFAYGAGDSAGTIVQDRVIAGSPKDFMEVRHLVLKGSNQDIGRALATIARERYSIPPMPSLDPLRTRVQRRYFEKEFPVLWQRMKGVAASYGKAIDDDSMNFSGLWYLLDGMASSGCSVVHYPPSTTTLGTGIVSRNYDFSTGMIDGSRPAPGRLAATARPYLIEMHPDRGYASMALCSYDLLSGVLDGMNSEGLTVALLADDELHQRYRMEPTDGPAVGLGVLQMLRYLLDNCATVEEAKEALLMTKQYYEQLSVHYLIADRHGKAFIWEYSQAHNGEYIVENDGKPLVTTNFSLHTRLNGKAPPTMEQAKNVCPRYCAICARLAETPGKVSPGWIKETQHLVDATPAARPSSKRALGRTLWHVLYFPEQRKLQVSFYLHDEPDSAGGEKPRIVRSDYLEFSLR
jgi:predicted choloylglycine hydrolase